VNENKMVETKAKKTKKENTSCADKDCPSHGHLKARGKIFEGKVLKRFHKRVVIGFERTIYIKKYERYAKSKTKIHARLPTCIEDKIQVGDLIKVQECRPLSKIIHFVVVGKVKEDTK
jgi:small subunit ribosomal protein S17